MLAYLGTLEVLGSQHPVVLVDTEGVDGTSPAIGSSTLGADSSSLAALRRKCIHKAYPAMLYNMSEVIIYVTTSHLRACLPGVEYALACAESSARSGKPHLIIVHNKLPGTDFSGNLDDTAKVTREWMTQSDRTSALEHVYSSISVICIPVWESYREVYLKQVTQLRDLVAAKIGGPNPNQRFDERLTASIKHGNMLLSSLTVNTRVRLASGVGRGALTPAGATGVIIAVDSSTIPYEVRADGTRATSWYRFSDLEETQQVVDARFSIGSRVMPRDGCTHGCLKGQYSGVIKKDDHDATPYYVVVDGGEDGSYYTSSELVLRSDIRPMPTLAKPVAQQTMGPISITTPPRTVCLMLLLIPYLASNIRLVFISLQVCPRCLGKGNVEMYSQFVAQTCSRECGPLSGTICLIGSILIIGTLGCFCLCCQDEVCTLCHGAGHV